MKNTSRKTLTIVLITTLLTVGIIGAIAYSAAPNVMMLEDESLYDFVETTEKFEAAVLDAGWKIAHVHDMQATLDGFGHDVLSVKIYELCSSKYSAVILAEDDERIVSALMPCRVAIYEKSNGVTYVSRMNSELMAKPFGGIISEVMQQAAVETEEILNQILK